MRAYPSLTRYWHDQSGATAIEYGLIVAMLTVVVVGIAGTGSATEALYDRVMAIADAISGSGGESGGGEES